MATTTEEAAGDAVTAVPADDGVEDAVADSLIIPITTAAETELFVEIFPDEIKDTPVATLLQVLRTEGADDSVWADAALMYMQSSNNSRDSLTLLQAIDNGSSGDNATSKASPQQRVRVLASTGICLLAAHSNNQKSSGSSNSNSGNNNNAETDEIRQQADQKFTQAASLDTFFPMTWMGRGMLNLAAGRIDQANFFFQTTAKECGPVLPALLGLAAVLYGQGKYAAAQQTYGQAMERFGSNRNNNNTSVISPCVAASLRVGFAMCCVRLGQVDRAKAAFARALALDPEYVPAMVGSAVLSMGGDDGTGKKNSSSAGRASSSATEQAIRTMSMANLLHHSNSMVQNHLANHYFWKWTAVTGTVQVSGDVMTTLQPMPLEQGDPVRIGTLFETTILEVLADDEEEEEDDDALRTRYRLAKPWTEAAAEGLKVWKKDYERVFALAKGAYSSTSVAEIQAESLFFMARVYHVRQDNENAYKFYDRACKLAPDLTPARFGLAQTLIADHNYPDATKQLVKLVTESPHATDAHALLGLLRVRAGQHDEGLASLRKAMELDPANPDLVVLEALALQQHKAHYSKSLGRYRKAVELFRRRQASVPYEIYTNLGVLCQETGEYDKALENYKQALGVLDQANDLQKSNSGGGDSDTKNDGATRASKARIENVGVEGIRIVHPDNAMFCGYVETSLRGSVTDGKVTVQGDTTDLAFLVVGERIRMGAAFETEIVAVESPKEGESAVVLELKETYDPMTENDDDAAATTTDVPMSVLRENSLLEIDRVTTVAFNIARLHEASGKTLAAIELHKAIAKRNPAYVNSYLRLACIAVDCGSLNECAQWLKIAAASAPGNSEVLTLIGNLHLSLCDWKPAQRVFDGLMAQKIPTVEAYSALSMGNIYFANLHVSEQRYSKNLQHASDYYKRILTKDPLNAYAANGLGTVLAERGEIFKAKEVFHRVREVADDGIADALLNLGHIFLAQKKHSEALQVYKSYMKKAQDGTTPITSKSRTDDVVDVLIYIAFAYFDWARHTELYNDANAAPADGRYKEAMEHLELALSKNSKKETILKYNLCMTRLQAANCVLQKLTRNIPRTVEEVAEALAGLEQSLVIVQQILDDKEKGEKKINIRTNTLEDFLKHCRANITSAQSHLEDERKRAQEEKDEQEIRRLAAEAALKEVALRDAIKRQEEAKLQEERDAKADRNMQKVSELQAGWIDETKAANEKKIKKQQIEHPELEEEGGTTGQGLFDDSDDDSDAGAAPGPATASKDGTTEKDNPTQSELFGDSDDDSDDDNAGGKMFQDKQKEDKKTVAKPGAADDDSDDDVEFEGASTKEDAKPAATSKDLFGDSDDEESDEELVPTGQKRGNEETEADDSEQPPKKQKVDDGAEAAAKE